MIVFPLGASTVLDPLHVKSFNAINFLSAMLEDKLTVPIDLSYCASWATSAYDDVARQQ